MKKFNAGDSVWFMKDGNILNKRIHSKTEKLSTMDHGTIEVSYIVLDDRNAINSIEYALNESEMFETKKEVIDDFVNRNS